MEWNILEYPAPWLPLAGGGASSRNLASVFFLMSVNITGRADSTREQCVRLAGENARLPSLSLSLSLSSSGVADYEPFVYELILGRTILVVSLPSSSTSTLGVRWSSQTKRMHAILTLGHCQNERYPLL